jgi:hypothetical protein
MALLIIVSLSYEIGMYEGILSAVEDVRRGIVLTTGLLQSYRRLRNGSVFRGFIITIYLIRKREYLYQKRKEDRGKEGGLFPPAPSIYLGKR